jgi:hypothetical protein
MGKEKDAMADDATGGDDQFLTGMEVGDALRDKAGGIGRALATTAKQAADYQSIVDDIALVAMTTQPQAWEGGNRQEIRDKNTQAIAAGIAATAREQGVERNALGKAVGQLVGKDTSYGEALALAPKIAQFSVGQKVSVESAATLVASLKEHGGATAANLDVSLARVAKFGYMNGVEREQLTAILPQLMRDLANLGVKKDETLLYAQAMLEKAMEKEGDPKKAAQLVHTALLGKRGNGSEAHKEAARKALAATVSIDEQKTAPVDTGLLERDQKAVRARSESTWAETGRATENAGRQVGDVLRPVTDWTAEALTGVATGAGELAQAWPSLTRSAAVVAGTLAAAAAAFGTWKAASGMFSLGKGMLGRGGVPTAGGGNAGVQDVRVLNWPAGMGGSGGAGLPELPDRNGRPGGGRPPGPGRGGWLARAWQGVRNGRSTLHGALNSQAGRFITRRFGLLAAGATGLELVQAYRSGSQAGKDNAHGAMVAMGVGAALGGLAGGPGGAMLGASLGRAAFDVFLRKTGEKSAEKNSGKNGETKPSTVATGPAPAPFVMPATPPFGAAGLGPHDRTWTQSVLQPAPLLVAGVAAAWPLQRAPGLTAPGWAPLSVTQAGATALAVAGSKTPVVADARTRNAPDPIDKFLAPALPALPAGGKGAVAGVGAAPQFTFKPSITVTVQGDVREPRRIAEELMPYLRQLFDQFQGQQQRSSLFDGPLTAGGIAT